MVDIKKIKMKIDSFVKVWIEKLSLTKI
jgi:hypothetical protein